MSHQTRIDPRVCFGNAGCWATSPIPHVGTELITESPWLVCPTNSQPEDIINKLQKAGQQDVARFMPLGDALSSSTPPPTHHDHEVIEPPSYLDIFKYHSLRCGTGPWKGGDVAMSGLFHWASWLHRSCDPNVHGQWIWPGEQGGSTGKMVFRSLRPINIGEPLSVSPDVRGILCSRAIRHSRFTQSCLRRCHCRDLSQEEQEDSDGRRGHISLIVSQVIGESVPEDNTELIPNIETALKCLEEEGIYHYRDTLGYALFKAYEASPNRNNAMLSQKIDYAWRWAMVFVGPSDERVIGLKKHLDRLRRTNLAGLDGNKPIN